MYPGEFGYYYATPYWEAKRRNYAIGSPRGTTDTYGVGNELRRTGKVYITQEDETNDFDYIQTISPRGKYKIWHACRYIEPITVREFHLGSGFETAYLTMVYDLIYSSA